MIGHTLGHYRIVEKIGAGGMGEVYRARDEHLGRDVAIKVLPAGTLADEAARKRFRKEAQALSKLNHPNIATVHDFDTQEGVDFLVMENIPGVTLSDRLETGPLPEKEIARLGAQLAEGLAAAHEHGVLHRDLKPGNLRVTPDGRLKILDFGLAKLLRPVSETATTESLTETQAAPGTLPYMAPEQLQGEKADARTDIYAVGTVLYEMATGRRPFEQKLASALIADIVHKPPTPPTQLNPKLSSRLEEIILKCLEKEPENRYQSAKELGVDLRRLALPSTPVPVPRPRHLRLRYAAVAAGLVILLVGVLVGLNVGGWRDRLLGRAGTPQIDSLAVLPLANLSGNPEQEYFADGMTEALITDLSKISALKVISRTSVMQYKGVKKPLRQIGRDLDVDAVVEGSVVREGNRVRVTVQLIEASTDRHLWAESYERDLTSILALQSEVARTIANEIKVKVAPQEQARLASARPVNPEAYEAYLKGRYYWNKRTEAGIRKGIEYFQQAIEKDPTWALAYAGLADCYVVLPVHAFVRPDEAYPKAKAAALKALELDDSLTEAHASLAYEKDLYEWDWPGAEREFKRALELNPNDATAHHWYALHLAFLGRMEDSIREIRRAQELDPLSLIINANVGGMLSFARRYDEAIAQYQKTLEMDPNFYYAHYRLGLAYRQKGKYEEALAELQKAVSLSGGTAGTLAALGRTYALAGKKTEALKILEQLKELSKRRYIRPGNIALLYADLGDKEQAFAWLEKSYEDRSAGEFFLKADPGFDSLRSDPRFQDLLRRMNFPE